MSSDAKAGLRLMTAERHQISWDRVCLDEFLPEDHRARQVLAYVEELDLSELYSAIRSVEGRAGRPGVDPTVLMTLWLYATLEEVGSARQLARLCERDMAYRWVLGGVKVSHKTLSDFRTEAGPVLDKLLTQSVTALAAAKVIRLERIAVDGMRVRASAGSNSFRRKQRLADLYVLAEAKVQALKAELESDPGASERRTRARRERAAEDRRRRVHEAHEAMAELERHRASQDKAHRRKKPANGSPPRVSTSDPQARVMKMADGGFRPAYNARLVTDVGSGLVIGVTVGNNGSDRDQLGPAVAEIEERYGQRPKQVLADGGFDGKADIEALHRPENGAIEVYCPRPRNRKDGTIRPLRKDDGPGVRAWHHRMMSDEGQALYRQRFAMERPHADMRNRGLTRVLVRGMQKVKAVVLWHVHAFNFLTQSRLQTAA